jgi:hypothetical protein
MLGRSLTTARVAGVLYLVVIVFAGFAEAVRSSMVESGDSAATAENIRDSESLFRIAFSADVIAFSADVALALTLFVLLKPVNEVLSLLAAFFRLAQASALGINLIFMFLAVLLTGGDGYLTSFDENQIDSLVLLFMEGHSYGYLIGLVFFALSNVCLGYLVVKSGYLPRLLGYGLMILVPAGYLVDSFTRFLGAESDALSIVVILPAAVTELAFAAWLLAKGGSVRLSQQREAAE